MTFKDIAHDLQIGKATPEGSPEEDSAYFFVKQSVGVSGTRILFAAIMDSLTIVYFFLGSGTTITRAAFLSATNPTSRT